MNNNSIKNVTEKSTWTSPIECKNVIAELKRMTKRKKDLRTYLICVIGMNTGLRISDILAFKKSQLKFVKMNTMLRIVEQKTRKPRMIPISKNLYDSYQYFLSHHEYSESGKLSEYIFAGRKVRKNGINNMTTSSAAKLVRTAIHEAFESLGRGDELVGKVFCNHSLRKTYCYQLLNDKTQPVQIEKISKMLGHRSIATTLTYLGITEGSIEKEIGFRCI